MPLLVLVILGFDLFSLFSFGVKSGGYIVAKAILPA